jgi:hypothetical protein
VSALMAVFHDLIVESDASTTGGVSSDHSFPLFLRISDNLSGFVRYRLVLEAACHRKRDRVS